MFAVICCLEMGAASMVAEGDLLVGDYVRPTPDESMELGSPVDVRKFYEEMVLEVSECDSVGRVAESDAESEEEEEADASILSLPVDAKHLYELAWAGVETTASGLENSESYEDRSMNAIFETADFGSSTCSIKSVGMLDNVELPMDFGSIAPEKALYHTAFVADADSVVIDIPEEMLEYVSVGVQVSIPPRGKWVSVFRSVVCTVVPMCLLYFCM